MKIKTRDYSASGLTHILLPGNLSSKQAANLLYKTLRKHSCRAILTSRATITGCQ
ncbi:MAG: hypothetical protein V7K48_25775 [Nostoc sp.]|uniref:hypothetical protein n=1 Tax=Nostoc sp. TaxID=1180 RepID=UPI002FF9BFBB